MTKNIIQLIRLYKRFFSPFLLPCCRYHPTCSEYTMLAIEKHGTFLGIFKSLLRLLRCNPLSRGGLDLP